MFGFGRPSILSLIAPIAIAGAIAIVGALGLTILNDAKRTGFLEAAAKRDAVTREITLESLDQANALVEQGNADLAARDRETDERIAAVEAGRVAAERERDDARAATEQALALMDELGQCPAVPEETRECSFDDLLPPLPE